MRIPVTRKGVSIMALKFVEELPKSARKPKATTSTVFTDDIAEELRANPGKWAKVEKGTAQGAAAWVKRMKETSEGFEYESVDTGKPNGPKRKAPKGDGMYQPTVKDIYVRYNPDLKEAE